VATRRSRQSNPSSGPHDANTYGCQGSFPVNRGSSAQVRVHCSLRFGPVLLARNHIRSNLDFNPTLACASIVRKVAARGSRENAPSTDTRAKSHSKQPTDVNLTLACASIVREIAGRFSCEDAALSTDEPTMSVARVKTPNYSGQTVSEERSVWGAKLSATRRSKCLPCAAIIACQHKT